MEPKRNAKQIGRMKILFFIERIRQSDEYIEHIFTQGSCYQFYVLLSKLFSGCEPYISPNKMHVITKYSGKYYDIHGIVLGNWYTPMTPEEIEVAKGWSFRKNNLIQLSECPYCEEPIIYNFEKSNNHESTIRNNTDRKKETQM